MGCVQVKGSTYSPSQGLETLKIENGYVKGVSKVVAVGEHSGKLVKKEGGGEVNVGPAGEGEAAKGGGAGEGVRRVVVKKKIEGDELVDGWPKWLVDNIPPDVLASLVPKSADSYDKLAKVGQGTYSNVYKARDRDTGKIVALKKVRFDTSEPESVKFMAREIRILQKLDHPNVIKLEGLATSRMQYSLYLVFDFMQSDLTRVISRPGQRLTLPEVNKNGMLKIADFGLANFYNLPKPKRPMTSRVVTLWYRAPELLLGSTDYGVGIDLWSAGCLLAEMFLGRPVMPGRTEVEQLHRIFKLCGSPSDDYWKKMKFTVTFRPPHLKPSFQEVFSEFPRSSFGILTTLLALDPSYRGTAASALQFEFFSSSPLPCDLSGLPVIYKEEDESAQTTKHKKNKRSKAKKSTRTKHKAHRRKDSTSEESKGDQTESSKELEKNPDSTMQMVSSTASSSSSSKPTKILHDKSFDDASPSPIQHNSHAKTAPRTEGYPNINYNPSKKMIQNFTLTEGHPNALKNIQNISTLLHASISDIIDHRQGNAFAPFSRSLSTLDFTTYDAEKMSKLFGSDQD
ncbi:hypothetical protein Pint_27033 [Pistacia integerrima]|uniref:Uncharacterized protein n=1 Tax=Pistacia integerrima TaxID=434235 RepID=A0ACC0YRV2_9ROSI|nr:hypothetical protein Pint_27033 [Pistacia integerrima]